MRLLTRWGFLVLGAGALSACTAATTASAGDPSIDFARFHTYSWKQVHARQDPVIEGEIEKAVDAALASRGLRRVATEPDLWVVVHTRLSHPAQVSTYDSGWGYAAGEGWGGAATAGTAASVAVGDLLVDLVDAASRKLVWRGSASGAVDPGASLEQRDRMLADAVSKMFAGYPPGRSAPKA